MNGKMIFASVLIGLAALAGTSLASPAEARNNNNVLLNQMAMQMYQQNMATQAQFQAADLARQQDEAAYRAQMNAINQAALNNPYYGYAPYNNYAAPACNHLTNDVRNFLRDREVRNIGWHHDGHGFERRFMDGWFRR